MLKRGGEMVDEVAEETIRDAVRARELGAGTVINA